jgi:hypothetical protein
MTKRGTATVEKVSLPTIDEMTEEPKRMSVEVRSVSLTIPAMVGLGDTYATRYLHARLNTRESQALRVLVEGFDNKLFESPGSRSANGQDWLRYILNSVADELGL